MLVVLSLNILRRVLHLVCLSLKYTILTVSILITMHTYLNKLIRRSWGFVSVLNQSVINSLRFWQRTDSSLRQLLRAFRNLGLFYTEDVADRYLLSLFILVCKEILRSLRFWILRLLMIEELLIGLVLWRTFTSLILIMKYYICIFIYSRTFMARTSLGPWKFVRDMGSSSHWGFIMAPCQVANGHGVNFGKSFWSK